MKGLCTSTRVAPPSHFLFKVKSFSKLTSTSLEKYESCVFYASGYKWKLVVYPNGNKASGAEDHISLYLVPADSQSKVASVTFSLFVFDHIHEKFLYAQEVSENYPEKSILGFDRFLPLKSFIDPSNGYLSNDNCMFGAEVFHLKNEATSQCLSMIARKPHPCRFTWEVETFSKLQDKAYHSNVFRSRGHDWQLKLFPKGTGVGRGICLSLFLHLADSKTLLPEGKDVVVEYKLRVVDQLKGDHKEEEAIETFNSTQASWGRQRFLCLKDLNGPVGYLVDDTCIIEAEIIVLGSAKMS